VSYDHGAFLMSCTEDCTSLDPSQHLRNQPKSVSLILFVIATFCCLFSPCSVQGQTAALRGPSYSDITINEVRQQSPVLRVLDSSRSLLDRQSVVKLSDFERKTTVWRTTTDQSALKAGPNGTVVPDDGRSPLRSSSICQTIDSDAK